MIRYQIIQNRSKGVTMSDGSTSSTEMISSFDYFFPFKVTLQDRESLKKYNLDISDGCAFLVLREEKELPEKDAYKKLSIDLTFLALYEKRGWNERPVGGLGGFHKKPHTQNSNNDYINHTKHKKLLNILNGADDGYSIQSRFTFSRAYSCFDDPESSSIEFFKIIELFIKYCAFKNMLSPEAIKQVKLHRLFDEKIKKSLFEQKILKEFTVELLWELKKLRNTTIGHGGIRPLVSQLFGDPDSRNGDKVDYLFSDTVEYNMFFEKYRNDVEIMASVLFCKMNQLHVPYQRIPGCWWQPSACTERMLKDEQSPDNL
jgi:hypothetical protein